MNAKFKINQKVTVTSDEGSFDGEVFMIMEFTNPFNRTKGFDYVIRNNDGRKFKVNEEMLSSKY